MQQRTGGAEVSEPMGERVSSLEEWVKGHEALCAQRYGDLKDIVIWLVRGVFGLLIAIVAWLVVQLWNGNQARIAVLEQAAQTRGAEMAQGQK